MFSLSTTSFDILSHLLAQKEAAVALAITFGIKTNLPRSTAEAMQVIGASHLLVLSGANIALLANFLETSLFLIPEKTKQVLVIALICLFVAIIPTQPSVIRALIMFVATRIGVLFKRRTHSMYLLLLTFFIMLFIDGNLLNNISFQLSFAALFGIVYFDQFRKSAPIIVNQPKPFSLRLMTGLKTYVWEQLYIGVSAQAFVTPLIFYHFSRISLLGVVSTILLSIVITPIMALTILSLLAYVIFPPLASAPILLLSPLVRYIIVLSEFLATIPGITLYR